MSIQSAAGRAPSLLYRTEFFQENSLSNQQIQLDALVGGFAEGASDWRSLMAMTLGGFAFRATKLGVMSVGAQHAAPVLSRLLAPVLGLASEVTVFRGVNGILSCRGEPVCSSSPVGQTHRSAPTWSGWLTDFVSFGSLKIFGRFSQGQNPLFSHSLQSMGMVVGNYLAYGLNLATRPQGTFVEQFTYAEMTNLQMQAGGSLAGIITGNRLSFVERSFELQKSSVSARPTRAFEMRESLSSDVQPVLRMSSGVNGESWQRLVAVQTIADIYPQYRGTPIESLLAYHNLGRPFDTYASAEVLIGMCMDNRKSLRVPDNFAFVLRAGGANLRYSDFKVSYAIAIGGVKAIALMGHTQCGMSGLEARKGAFIEGMIRNAGWRREIAEEHFLAHSSLFEIGNIENFTMNEAHRLGQRYPKVLVAPLIYRVEDNRLYQIAE